MFLLCVYLTSLTPLSLISWPSCLRCMTTWDAQLQSSDPTSAAQRGLLSLRVSSKLGEKLLKSEAELVFLMFHRPNVAAGVSLHRDRERRRMRWRRYDPAPEAARWAVVGGEESSWSRWLVAPPTHAGGGEGYSNPTVIAALKLALLLGNLCHVFHVFWV